MLPKTMKFEPKIAGIFQPMRDTTPDNVRGTGPLRADQVVAFRISGTGMLEELESRRQEAPDGKSDSAPRPGGGLGAPIDAPDPLQRYRFLILVGLAGVMTAGVIYVVRKTKPPNGEVHTQFGHEAPNNRIKKQASPRHTSRHHRQRAHV